MADLSPRHLGILFKSWIQGIWRSSLSIYIIIALSLLGVFYLFQNQTSDMSRWEQEVRRDVANDRVTVKPLPFHDPWPKAEIRTKPTPRPKPKTTPISVQPTLKPVVPAGKDDQTGKEAPKLPEKTISKEAQPVSKSKEKVAEKGNKEKDKPETKPENKVAAENVPKQEKKAESKPGDIKQETKAT